MGWLHYTERDCLDTTIPALEAAIAAHIEDRALQATGRFGILGPQADEAPAEPREKPTFGQITAVLRRAAAPRKG